jgi:hypothetical protein
MTSINGTLANDNYALHASARDAALEPVAPEPSLPRTLWRAWQAYGHRAAGYQTEILFSGVYFFVLAPSGWLARLFGRELLNLGQMSRASYWIARKPADTTLQGMQRQF